MACREFEMGRVSVHIFAHVKSQLLFFFLIKKMFVERDDVNSH